MYTVLSGGESSAARAKSGGDLSSIAEARGWTKVDTRNSTTPMESYKNVKGERVNYWHTTGTMGTCLEHPKQGKTQLFRKDVNTQQQAKEIFDNPRKHTGKGYHRREEPQSNNNSSGGNNKRQRYDEFCYSKETHDGGSSNSAYHGGSYARNNSSSSCQNNKRRGNYKSY
jgi:5'-3' exonuclease